MDNNVYVLYEADQWISNNSLVPMGIFDSWDNVMEGAMKLLKDQIDRGLHDVGDDLDGYLEDVHDELKRYKQFRGYDASIYIKTVRLNELGEF